MKHRRLGWAAFTFLLAITMLAPFMVPSRAAAAPDPPGTGAGDIVITFLDRAHIEVLAGADYKGSEGIYYDQDLNDENFNYKQGGPDKKAGVVNGCQSEIDVKGDDFPKKYGDSEERKVTFKIKLPATASGGGDKCQKVKEQKLTANDRKISGTDDIMFKRQTDYRSRSAPGFTSSIIFFKPDANTIYDADNDPVYDNTGGRENIFRVDTANPVKIDGTADNGLPSYYQQEKQPSSDCAPVITNADFGSPTDAHYYLQKKVDGTCKPDLKILIGPLRPFDHVLVLQQRPDAFSQVAASPSNTGDNVEDNCSIPTWGLRWVACPLIVATQKSIDVMDNLLQNLLIIDANEVFDTSKPAGKAYFAGFRAFQTIAFSIIVIVALVLVIGTSAGFELLDAYTMRKGAPRFLFAVAGLVLLWPFLEFIVRFFDNMTNWTGDLISAPFKALPGGASTGFKEIAAQWLIGGTAIAAFGIIGLLSMAATLFLGMLTLMIVLLGRKIIILACIITAPVAVICSVLPNTQMVWKFWRGVFIPAEMAGIAIAAIEGAGIAAARVAKTANVGGVGDSMAVIIIIVTQFLLLAGLRRLGGAFSAFTGSLDDRRRGVSAGLANFRRNRAQQRFHAMQRGDLYSGSNAVSRGFNAVTKGTNDITRSAAVDPRRWRRKYAQTKDQQTSQAAAAIMQSQGFKDIANNDDALMAAHYNSEREAVEGLAQRWNGDRKRASEAVAAAQAAGMKIGTSGFRVASAMQRVSTGTGYDNMEDMVGTLSRAAEGNESLGRRLAGFSNAETKKVGRNDLAPGYSSLNNLVQASINGAAPNAHDVNNATVEAALGTDNATLMRNKPQALTNFTNALNDEFRRASTQATNAATAEGRRAGQERVGEVLAKLENMRDSGIYAPEVNLRNMSRVLDGAASTEREAAQYEVKTPTLQVQQPIYARDAQNRVIVDAQGRPQVSGVQTNRIANPDHSPEAAAAYNAVRSRQPYNNPADPNSPINMQQ